MFGISTEQQWPYAVPCPDFVVLRSTIRLLNVL